MQRFLAESVCETIVRQKEIRMLLFPQSAGTALVWIAKQCAFVSWYRLPGNLGQVLLVAPMNPNQLRILDS
jgi:hypothetical protein